MTYVDYIYEAIKKESEGLDAVYEDFIVRLIGTVGLEALQICERIEPCGIVNGRQLYVLC